MNLFKHKCDVALFVFAIACFFITSLPNSTYAFSNGANATDLIGQYAQNDGVTPDYIGSNSNDAPGLYGLFGPRSMSIDSVNHRLFMIDSYNHRVLVFNLNASDQLVDKTPDYVLGQSTFYTNTIATTQSGLNYPRALAYDNVNQRLFVSDASNRRVLVYDVNAITNGENAINVLGQANFTSAVSTTTQSGLGSPSGVAYDGTNQRLFVADLNNRRVLIYDVNSITNGENAANVLGQGDFTSANPATTQSGMSGPQGVTYDATNQRLFVVDATNHRVLAYDVISITNGENAVNVLGQANFTSAVSATTQSGMNGPEGLTYDGTNQRLFVVDATNHRVTIYNATSTIINGANAINVLGQANFTSANPATTQSGMNVPQSVVYDGTNQRLFVSEDTNNRVTIYNATSTIINGAAATDLIGQYAQNDGVTPDYISSNSNDAPGLYGLVDPRSGSIDSVNHRLFVPDNSNHRILVFNLNASDQLVDKTPDYVLGQSTFYTNTAVTTQSGIRFPEYTAYDSANQRLFVSGADNRVLIYDVNSITNGENAANVLGQANFTSAVEATTQSGMIEPEGLAYDGTNQRLFVSEDTNNRVTIYDVNSITNGENAANVLGQTNFTNDFSATTQSGMSGPQGIAHDNANQRLFVADNTNNRVLIYDVNSITNGENAINVLGQANFTSAVSTTTQSGLGSPSGATYDSTNQRLFVGNTLSNRISIFSIHLITAELSTLSSASADETSAGNFPQLLVFGTSTATSTIQLDIIGGSAVMITDYTSSDPITVTIPPGAYDGTLNTAITITPPTLVQDSVFESGGETLLLSLINPSNVIIEDANLNAVIQSTATYTITDDDVSAVPAVIGPVGGGGGGGGFVDQPVLPPPPQAPEDVPAQGADGQPVIIALAPGDNIVNIQHVNGRIAGSAIQQGKRSQDVLLIQKVLNADRDTRIARVGPKSPGREDNIFNGAVKVAVGKFQLKHKIVKNRQDRGFGMVGPKTKAKMNQILKDKWVNSKSSTGY